MFTIRVMIETIKPQNCLTCCSEGDQSILDTFVIVNGQTAFNKLVEYVLKDLGMPYLIPESKGLIQINNWKPLLFEQITDNLQQPITNLLKDISSNLTLKILSKKNVLKAPNIQGPINGIIKPRINSYNNGSIQQTRLPDPNHHGIQSTTSNSESSFLYQDNVTTEHSVSDSSDNEAKDSNQFCYNSTETTTLMKTETSEFSPNNTNNNLPTSCFSEFTTNNNLSNLPSTSTTSSPSASSYSNAYKLNGRETSQTPKHLNNFHNSGRSRLMFDLLTEIPILEQWFQENPHPNWLQIEGYTNALNEEPYRKNSSTPMTNLNIKIWFKNRRAKSKRSSIK